MDTHVSPPLTQDLDAVVGTEAVVQRLRESHASFHASDNIAAHVTAEDMLAIEKSVEHHVRAILAALAIDVAQDPHSRETPSRYARMLVQALCQGRLAPRPQMTRFPSGRGRGTLQVIGPIAVRSACAHHLVPIIGNAWLGVVPGEWYLGLSKFHRLTNWIMARPQVQEDAAEALADEIEQVINPLGCSVLIEAEHLCCSWRGVKERSAMRTLVLRGQMANNHSLRSDFLSLSLGRLAE